jgi:acetyltransferase-like isoleucine patch superfamily enzyme
MKSTGYFGKMGSGSYFGNGSRFINPRQIDLGNGVCFGVDARVECYCACSEQDVYCLSIGEGTTFGDRVHLGCANSIKIGKNVLFGSNILIVDHSHGTPGADIKVKNLVAPSARPIISKGKIRIEDNVWVGDAVVILPNVTIGEGAIIGAGAIVRTDIPARTIYLDR